MEEEEPEREPGGARNFDLFNWGGVFNVMVPQNFLFPECNVQDLFRLWFFGNQHYTHSDGRAYRLRPYKYLTDVSRLALDVSSRKLFSHASCVMQYLLESTVAHPNIAASLLDQADDEDEVTAKQVSTRISSCASTVVVDEVYQNWWIHCINECKIETERPNSMCYSAVYKHHIAKNNPYIKRRRPRQQQQHIMEYEEQE